MCHALFLSCTLMSGRIKPFHWPDCSGMLSCVLCCVAPSFLIRTNATVVYSLCVVTVLAMVRVRRQTRTQIYPKSPSCPRSVRYVA